MEEGFFKSALPSHDSFLLDVSSLALAAEPTTGSASKVSPRDRNQRVLQQVQLTLARKSRRTVSNGNVEFLNSIFWLWFICQVITEEALRCYYAGFHNKDAHQATPTVFGWLRLSTPEGINFQKWLCEFCVWDNISYLVAFEKNKKNQSQENICIWVAENNLSYFLFCYLSCETHFSATDFQTTTVSVCVCVLLLSFRLNIVIFCGWNACLIVVCPSNRFLQFHSSA